MSNFKQLQDRKTSWPKPEKNAEAKKNKTACINAWTKCECNCFI